MSDQPETLDLRSHDIADEKRAALLQIFPEAVTEGGKIDFDRLKLTLGQTIDVGKERYSMNWPGKADCFKSIQAPSMGTLRPYPEESVEFDITENLIIEGDNLEVLKLLQKSYLGKVKMIYIDPPYNTGGDFVYPDNYADSMQVYLQYTGQVDAAGKKFDSNTDTDGRYHSSWLNMMYPRLYLARNLLRKDGVIFISIDDVENSNLRKICDEAFGEENFVSTFVWNSSTAGGIRPKHVSQCHEYALMYARSKESLPELYAPLSPEAIKQYGKSDERGLYREKDFAWRNPSDNPNQKYPIEAPDGSLLYPGPGYLYRFVKESFERAKAGDLVVFKQTKTSPLVDENGERARFNIYIKKHLGTAEGAPASIPPRGLVGLSSRGSEEIKALMDGQLVFTNPKSTDYLNYLFTVGLGGMENPLVLDFFAGSGTTAHAVLKLNNQDGGMRKFILVQLPEPLDPDNKSQRSAATFCKSIGKPLTIAEITKERVHRVIKKLAKEDAEKPLSLFDEQAVQQDRGFRVFKLDESNFQPWDADASRDADALAQQLAFHINHIRTGRSAEDILYEILLKSGFPLTTSVETLTLTGKSVYSVVGDALLICLEDNLTLDLIRTMANLGPERVVCLDVGFSGNDQLKTNAAQVFKTKGVTSFKTI